MRYKYEYFATGIASLICGIIGLIIVFSPKSYFEIVPNIQGMIAFWFSFMLFILGICLLIPFLYRIIIYYAKKEVSP